MGCHIHGAYRLVSGLALFFLFMFMLRVFFSETRALPLADRELVVVMVVV